MAKTRYTGWRRRAAFAFQLFSVLILMLSVERLVFDVFGQMWGTMLLNTMSALCTVTGVLGVCISEKTAIGVYAMWAFISIGLNVVIVLVYNDIGLLSQKEHYLGLVIGNDNWWRTHGINCGPSHDQSHDPDDYDGSGPLSNATEGTDIECYLSYATTETIHAAVYMALAAVTLLLAMMLLCSRENPQEQPFFDNEDDESFSYLSVAQWHESQQQPKHYFRRWGMQRTYDTNKTLWYVTSAYLTH